MKRTNATRSIELLAPARNLECGIAALRCGADAVYIGAPKFSARKAVGNSIQDIETLAREAHKYWAKVYVALNTILFDDEIDEARKIIEDVYSAGADGIILQDMGILELDLPPIPLIASTQVHNYSLDHIQFLESAGFQRVILARELSLKQIEHIRQHTTLELETFVHGALCVSFSGRCYLSYVTQRRSANRGECAQPCRLPYSLRTLEGTLLARDEYLLSLKDLNLSSHLEELIQAGVTSFKIEGRLKDIDYVKNVTAFYRKQLDNVLASLPAITRASSGTVNFGFTPDPARTFNRGFTTYFLKGRQKDILSRFTPKSIGSFIGRVVWKQGNRIKVDTTESFCAGDGLCFFDNERKLCGTRVQKVEGEFLLLAESAGVVPGVELYRNYDAAFSKELDRAKTRRLIDVQFTVESTETGFRITATDEDGVTVAHEENSTTSVAKNPEQMKRILQTQLSKSGNTIFRVARIDILSEKLHFIPLKDINEMRRRILELLEQERLKQAPRTITSRRVKQYSVFPLSSLDSSYNVGNIYARQFYERCGVRAIQPAVELNKTQPEALMTTKHCLRFTFGICKGRRGNNEPLFLEDTRYRYVLEFDCSECVMKIRLEGKK